MSENPTTTETRTVRELARELCIAQDAYNKAYWANSSTLPINERIDAQLAQDAAFKAVNVARAALTAAQREQVSA